MKYFKYQVLGNSFILIKKENSSCFNEKNINAIKKILSVDLGIGADGLLIFDEVDNSIEFFNVDGSKALFCGNGIRAYYAYLDKFNKTGETGFVKTLFGGITYAGKALKKLDDYNYYVTVKVKNQKSPIEKLELAFDNVKITGYLTKIGVEHFIIFKKDNLATFDLLAGDEKRLEEVQNNPVFNVLPNLDLVEELDERVVKVKTYERGVGFTASCGSGALASAYVYHKMIRRDDKQANYKIITKYGKSKVSVSSYNLILTSLVSFVSKGEYYG